MDPLKLAGTCFSCNVADYIVMSIDNVIAKAGIMISAYLMYTVFFQVLGGTDDSLYEGDIMYGRLHKEWYYEVIITDIKVASKSVGLPCKEVSLRGCISQLLLYQLLERLARILTVSFCFISLHSYTLQNIVLQ